MALCVEWTTSGVSTTHSAFCRVREIRPRETKQTRDKRRSTVRTQYIMDRTAEMKYEGSDVSGSEEYDEELGYEVSDSVRDFLVGFYRAVKDRDVVAISQRYERDWNAISSDFFSDCPWPPVESVLPHVEGDYVFSILYRELYYRHVYSRLQPTIEQRLHSWENYVDLFKFILNSATSLDVELPDRWLWDIIDEFIYQFQNFYNFRSKFADRQTDEIELLREHPELWAVQSVLGFLNELAERSEIVVSMARERGLSWPRERADGSINFSRSHLHRMLGYFGIIGLARVNCLIGDYHYALRILAPIDLNRRGLSTDVLSCHISTYYYVGFAYMMQRRYVDAIRSFSTVLLYIAKTKQSHGQAYQLVEAQKKTEQLYALLAVSIVICPMRLDHLVQGPLKEKHGERMLRMQQGDRKAFDELFAFGCPKFIVPAVPDFDDPSSQRTGHDALRNELKMFQREVREQRILPTIRSFLHLYTSIPLRKLGDFLESSSEEDTVAALLCFKHKQTQKVWNGGSPLSGSYSTTRDVQFHVSGDMVVVGETPSVSPSGDYFVQHTNQFLRIISGDSVQ